MKIYILRHEDRTIDCTFFSPLTQKGLENSLLLSCSLIPLNINEIYCSPFIRTLQTINPYIKKTNKKIKLEYSLTEIKHESIIPIKSHNVELPTYLAEIFNYDESYQTFINTNEISYPETSSKLRQRVINFLREIIIKNYKTQKNILLVTHQGICNIILNIIKANEDQYQLGKLSLIFDTDYWVYKKIN
jgi:broad specificity phosphatase PhoE